MFQQQAEGTNPKEPSKKLFVGGIKDDMTEDMFREEFSKYGNIKDIKIVKGRGFGFIEFDDNDPVDWCSCKYFTLNYCDRLIAYGVNARKSYNWQIERFSIQKDE